MNDVILNITDCEKAVELASYFAIHINSQEAEFYYYCLTDRCYGGVYRADDETVELRTLEDGKDLYALCAFRKCPFEANRCTKRLVDCEHVTITVRGLREIEKG